MPRSTRPSSPNCKAREGSTSSWRSAARNSRRRIARSFPSRLVFKKTENVLYINRPSSLDIRRNSNEKELLTLDAGRWMQRLKWAYSGSCELNRSLPPSLWPDWPPVTTPVLCSIQLTSNTFVKRAARADGGSLPVYFSSDSFSRLLAAEDSLPLHPGFTS